MTFADVAWDPLARSDLHNAWWAPRPIRKVLLGDYYAVRSKLPPETCAARLQSLVEARPKKMTGEVNTSRFVLRDLEMIGTTPATSLTAVGWIQPTSTGSLIEMRIALAPNECLGYLAVIGGGALGWLVLAKMLFLDDEALDSDPVKHAVFALAFPIAVAFSVLTLLQAANGKLPTPLPRILDAIGGQIEPTKSGSDSSR